MPILDELAQYAADGGLGTVDQDIHAYEMPADEVAGVNPMVLNATFSEDAIRVLCKETPSIAEQPHFQIAVRSDDPAAAWEKCHAACRLFDKAIGVTLGGVRYTHIQITQWPAQLKFDSEEKVWIVAGGRAVRAIAA